MIGPERLRSMDRPWRVVGAFGLALMTATLATSWASRGLEQATSGERASQPTSTATTSPTGDSAAPTTTFQDGPTGTSAPDSIVPRALPTAAIDARQYVAGYVLEFDADDPAVAARPEPVEPPVDEPPPSTIAPPPWASSTAESAGGHMGTDVGCADDLSAAALNRFLGDRLGPVLGWDYQHVYPLGGDRFLWLFQDAFIDHSGTIENLGTARFIHNAAMVQEGRCFRLLHRGSSERPDAFETGDGGADLRSRWFWPMGGELVGGELWVFWVEMIKDPYNPDPPDGLGWHPERTYLASYDASTLKRTSFGLAPNSGAAPIYGYAVASNDSHTYLFGNTFEQNMLREGGFWNGPHSATTMWLARVPRGRVWQTPEYRTANGWSPDPAAAVPIASRYFAENPMQPRLLNGQWVATTAVDGYWGNKLAVDVAPQPWGPWTTVHYSDLSPRNGDPKMNTYHAQPLPWRGGSSSVLITVSNNARNMFKDAWDSPYRYRPMVIAVPHYPTPAPPTTTLAPPPTTTVAPTSTSTTTTSSTSTTTTSSTSTTTTTTTSSTSTTTTTATVEPTTTTVAAATTTSSTEPSTTTTSTTTTTSEP